VYLDLDGAWDVPPLGLARRDARAWGPRLRCFALRKAMRRFIAEVAREMPPFVLYGSGDFHHVSAGLIAHAPSSALNVVVFDNHPDWDRRPPHWACGGWVNRALDLPHVRRVAVWGLGNFELNWPARLFGNRRIDTYAWLERYPKRGNIARDGWRTKFESFAESLTGRDVYVSVDMDCLDTSVTNWENGLFTAGDVAWGIRALRSRANVIAGDICGAWSPPVYARRRQRFAAEWDHPKIAPPDLAAARTINTKAVETIWPALVSSPTQSPRQR
jgi:arginase family enzyme